jgi:thiamine-monophosphate kinase
VAREFDRIDAIRRRAARPPGAVRLGIGDDAAILQAEPGYDTVISTDLLVEGVHFELDWSTPELLGRKALAVALSDLAAMGAIPHAALLSLALPTRVDDAFLDSFYSGVLALADRYGMTLAGGDLSASPGPIVIDSVVTGEVEKGRALCRSGARPGDLIYVSGSLGSSAAGLRQLRAGMTIDTAATGIDLDAIRTHVAPSPRVELGRALLLTGIGTAAIDLSDGLSSDIRHICRESNVGAIIEADLLPTHFPLDDALHGGEQYELLFATPPAFASRVALVAHQLKLDLTRIGRFEGAADEIYVEREERQIPLAPLGWEHFRS